MGVEIGPQFGQASVIMACNGVTDPLMFTFGYQAGSADFGTPGYETVDEQAAKIRDTLTGTGDMLSTAQMSAAYTFVSVSCIENRSGVMVPGVAPANVVGSGGTSPVPVNCSAIVRKNTSRAGRKGRGRMFLPPFLLQESDVSASGVIGGSTLGVIQARLDTWRDKLAAAGCTMVLLHSDPLDTPDVVTSLIVLPLLGTQRRRMR